MALFGEEGDRQSLTGDGAENVLKTTISLHTFRLELSARMEGTDIFNKISVPILSRHKADSSFPKGALNYLINNDRGDH